MQYLLGDKIRILRSLKGYSQKGLAKATGISQEAISYIETNKTRKQVRPIVLERIAVTLGTQVQELLQFNPALITSNASISALSQPQNESSQQQVIHLQQQTLAMLENLNKMYQQKAGEQVLCRLRF
jgi:transcriptional regulator with XRE-family HTH domain